MIILTILLLLILYGIFIVDSEQRPIYFYNLAQTIIVIGILGASAYYYFEDGAKQALAVFLVLIPFYGFIFQTTNKSFWFIYISIWVYIIFSV